ncbi:cation/multidrug efflux pump [Spongiibacter nanhainus]|uniref:Cation/multidrug efflux pump n=1 Tax=Spongiibacter nanhainus TaxID=2794344 RepID=A0A7T4URW4_9GAMM|nr:cation/multidrug efflux pump [Spongiibacter nanhainus]QQD19927.1 cation/multidrug efflux pump [Spongiibacter nanhainus]
MALPELDTLLLVTSGVCLLLSALVILQIRRRPLRTCCLSLVLVPLTGAVVVLTQDVISYRLLAEEEQVAKVFVAQSGDQRFDIVLDRFNGGPSQRFTLNGDQWMLEGRVLRWQLPMARMGLQNLVRLSRVSGRYQSLEQERNQTQRSVYAVESGELVDSWQWLGDFKPLRRWVEVDFGNAVFAPLQDGAVYAVYLGRSGLFLKGENPIAIKALQDWSSS